MATMTKKMGPEWDIVNCRRGASNNIERKEFGVKKDAVEERVEIPRPKVKNKARTKGWLSLSTVRNIPSKDMVQKEALPCGEYGLAWQ